MQCKWDYDDCQNINERCIHCITDGLHYKEPKQKKILKKRNNNGDKRKGSNFEVAAHKKNIEDLANLTINSGATAKEKGDEIIKGLAPLMIEYKTQMPNRAKGIKTFTIHREWLDKLAREAPRYGAEFRVLKFSFSEDEGMREGGQIFAILEDKMFQQMYACILNDRKFIDECDAKINLSQKRYERIEQENFLLKAKIEDTKGNQL